MGKAREGGSTIMSERAGPGGLEGQSNKGKA